MEKIFLTPEELCERYPAEGLTVPLRAWESHLRKWRRDGTLYSPVHWHTCMTPPPLPRSTIVYWECGVLNVIYQNRQHYGFCNLVYVRNSAAIKDILKSYIAQTSPTAADSL